MFLISGLLMTIWENIKHREKYEKTLKSFQTLLKSVGLAMDYGRIG